MNLSNTSQYAIRVISLMALDERATYSAAELISKLNVSDKYLKRILTKLTEGGILISIQGRYGGFKLARKVDNISIAEIIGTVENIEKYKGCILGFNECSNENPCILHDSWEKINKSFFEMLESHSLISEGVNRY